MADQFGHKSDNQIADTPRPPDQPGSSTQPPESAGDDTQGSTQMSPPVSDTSHQDEKTAEDTKRELQEAIEGSNEVLARATCVLQVFPDSMVIDRAKVTIVKRNFYRMADIMSMRIEDVLNATSTVGPIFGTVSVTSRVLNDEQTTHIGKFWRSDAKRLKRTLQGYVIALQRDIDCSKLQTKELAQMLEKLGADNHP